ncbi:aspartate/glutamate racemase family protein [Variovorax arabinosiphilus]|uniref:aspartate/glutamate racemase family protein n=1 Tax=Variovorax arabinosiphilus TaxID=3053498 RepID=UPI0025779E47|nr:MULTISPECIES: aspartate/glutamate racemase family protein [unclassified Variovorax]MDM0121974.1 aspartate/glutamate racemase family protein [Variovorax sp. J2L1-78]MDM0131496.1 aspartate/glutamate racemase family protein [Variovorax sp. J2L1-63]MDM0234737.1 aspartate/glutamate racemase family protein [Variovorax sp. J2R1-6]
MRIACLHTAESNIAVFEAAARELGIPPDVLRHEVRADLLAAAEGAGGLTADIADTTRLELLSLAQSADAVVLTCSTLGASVDTIAANSRAPVLRTDGALAAAAARAGGRIVALCTVETTIDPTSRLFFDAVQQSEATVEVQLVPEAWVMFKAGDLGGYLATIAKAADGAYASGASIVALAQASMSGAAALVSAGPRSLSSPTAGLAAALEAASPHLGLGATS